jgi:hypothetical protein
MPLYVLLGKLMTVKIIKESQAAKQMRFIKVGTIPIFVSRKTQISWLRYQKIIA